MLIVYGSECDIVVELHHRTYTITLHRLEITSEAWRCAEDVPQELFFTPHVGDDQGRVLEVIQRDEEQTVYQDKNGDTSLIIQTPD